MKIRFLFEQQEEKATNKNTVIAKEKKSNNVQVEIPSEIELPNGFIENTKNFLLLASNEKKLENKVKKYCEENKLFFFPLKSLGEALFLLERWAPKLIILDDNWSEFKIIFEKIYELQTEVRAKIFTILLSQKFESNNSKEAFCHSVDQIISHKDLNNFQDLIEKGKTEWLNFWKDYHTTFTEDNNQL